MSFASAGAGGDGALNLSEFQRVLRTSLNSANLRKSRMEPRASEVPSRQIKERCIQKDDLI